MKAIQWVLLLLLAFSFTDIKAQAPSWQWAKSGKGDGWDEAHGIATDRSGNLYTTGFFGGDSIGFDDIVLKKDSGTGSATFITKYDATGKAIWARKIENSEAYGIAVDGGGNIYITGNFKDATSPARDHKLESHGGADIFVVKYNGAGDIIWTRTAGGKNNDFAYGITTDLNGNVIVAGYFQSPDITFGKYKLKNSRKGYQKEKIYLVKYDSSGKVCWLRSDKSDGEGYAADVTTDIYGNIYVSGGFHGKAMTLGKFRLVNKTKEATNGFLARYDASGHVVWCKNFNCPDYSFGSAIKTDNKGNVFVTGFFGGAYIAFDQDSLIKNPHSIYDMFLAKYSASGTVVWAKSGGKDNVTTASDLCITNSGEIYVTGQYNQSVNFGELHLNSESYSPFQTFLVKYSSTGTEEWVKGVQGDGYNSPRNICSDNAGHIFVCGEFREPDISFDRHTLNNAGDWDMFVTRLGK